MTFEGKYNCLPGDCPNATTFFGTRDSQGYPVNNGNGNGTLDDQYTLGNGDGPVTLYEPMWAWQELALAGLIPGYYNGEPGHANNSNQPFFFQTGPDPNYYSPNGANAPSSKITSGVYAVLSPTTSLTDGLNGWYPGNYGNMIILENTSITAEASFPAFGPVISPQDAYAIDLKIDDGIPSSGSVLTATPSYAPNCNNWNQTWVSGTYNLSYQGPPACVLMFLRVF